MTKTVAGPFSLEPKAPAGKSGRQGTNYDPRSENYISLTLLGPICTPPLGRLCCETRNQKESCPASHPALRQPVPESIFDMPEAHHLTD